MAKKATPQRNWLGDTDALRKMVELNIGYLNATRAFLEAYKITPEEAESKIDYWYVTALRLIRSDKYKQLRDEYNEARGWDKEGVRSYIKKTMEYIADKNKDDAPDTVVRAQSLLAKVVGIDTNEKTDSNITINFTSGKQEN